MENIKLTVIRDHKKTDPVHERIDAYWIDDYCDRRFNSRVIVNKTALLEYFDPTSHALDRVSVTLLNMSVSGACIASDTSFKSLNSVRLRLSMSFNGSTLDAFGHIMSSNPETTQQDSKTITRIKFSSKVTNYDDLGQLIGQYLLLKREISDRRKATTIESRSIAYKNRQGEHIVGFHDRPKDFARSNNAFIIIPPSFGETKRDNLALSYYLAKNGFNVIRFDNTDHVGESSGEIQNTTLSKMRSDLSSTIDYIKDRFGSEDISVVASSLASRVAIKTATEDLRIKLLICLVPVVDLKSALKALYSEDMVGSWLFGKSWNTQYANIFGYEVNWNALSDAIEQNFHDLQSTKDDLSKVFVPTVFVAVDNDPLVDFNDVRTVYESMRSSNKELIVITNDKHRLDENSDVAKIVGKTVVSRCMTYLCNDRLKAIAEPNIREIALQNRIEKEGCRNLKKLHYEDERDFWSDYIVRFNYLVNVHDYWHYLSFLNDLIGGVKVGERILDAGCGNGSFGAFLIINAIFKNRKEILENCHSLFTYVGVDFSERGLEQAKAVHLGLQQESPAKTGNSAFASYTYIMADLTEQLSVKSGTFDKIYCNWVLSYLPDPLHTVRELVRVLKPGGRLIITSLKPHADLTTVYRNFIKVADSQEDIEEARKILNNAGAIKCKEANGYYNFFSEREMKLMAMMAGAVNIQFFRGFADQVNIVVAEKA